MYQKQEAGDGRVHVFVSGGRRQPAGSGSFYGSGCKAPGRTVFAEGICGGGGGQAYGGISGYVCDRERQGGMGLSV